MTQRFIDRGYPPKIVTKALMTASTIPRKTLLRDHTRKEDYRLAASFNRVPVFSTPYSVEYNKIQLTIKKYLLILLNDPIYQEILSKLQRS